MLIFIPPFPFENLATQFLEKHLPYWNIAIFFLANLNILFSISQILIEPEIPKKKEKNPFVVNY